jgi:hypothetical protein
MEVIYFSEMLVHIRTTLVYIPEDGNLHECEKFAVKQRFSSRESGAIYEKQKAVLFTDAQPKQGLFCSRAWVSPSHSNLPLSVSSAYRRG